MTFFSAEDLDAFERDGYAVVRGLFNGATLDQVLHWTEEVRNAPEIPGQPPMLYFVAHPVPWTQVCLTRRA